MGGSGSSALCFGKLPSHADFIRYNAASREALAFDEWLHHGLYHARIQLGAGWEQDFARAPMYRFLFTPENTDRSLVGVLQPSRDKSQRRYPFLVSLLLERQSLRDSDLPLVPAAFSSFFESADELVHRAMNGLEARELTESAQALNCPPPDPETVISRYQTEFLQRLSTASLWEGLFGSFDDPRKYLLFRNLRQALLPVRDRSFKRLSLGLRFPLLRDSGQTDFLACFWMNVTMTMLGTMPGGPFLFWGVPADGARTYLFVFFRQPSPKNFVQLIRPETDSDSICPVDEEGIKDIDRAATAMPSALRALLDKRDGSLSSFLRALTMTV